MFHYHNCTSSGSLSLVFNFPLPPPTTTTAEEEEDGNKERIHQWTDSTSTIDFCNQAVDYYEH